MRPPVDADELLRGYEIDTAYTFSYQCGVGTLAAFNKSDIRQPADLS